MANVNFNEIDFSGSGNYSGPSVGFFGLANDGDEALVRFMEDSTDNFDIVTTHQITVNGKYRRINCLRDPHDPMTDCPFCASGSQISNRFYIHLIQYVKDENGGIVPQAKVWERSLAYAKTLKSYIDNYGPLSDIMCKIIRHGAAGSMQTTYEIVPNLNKNIYRDDIYPKSAELFGDYRAVGNAVMNKSYEEIQCFLSTGNFPQNDAKNTVQQNTAPMPSDVPFTMNAPQQNNVPVAPVTNVAPPPQTQFQQTAPSPAPARQAPWQQPSMNAAGVSKPARYY